MEATMRRATFALLLLLECAPAVRAESWRITGPDVPALRAYDTTMQACMDARGFSQGALAVTRNGRLVLARGYTRGTSVGQVTQPTSLFRVASVTKPFTAVAVLQLVERGQISLDDKLSAIPYLRDSYVNKHVDPRAAQITIRQLLQHRAGFDRDASFDPMFCDAQISAALGRPLPTDPRMVIDYMATQPLDYDPGTKYVYSNFGYCLLGRVIEEISGQSYASFVQANVFDPLGITRMRLARALEKYRAPGEVTYEDKSGSLVPTVMGADGPALVPRQYGGWNIETMDSHGGWLASVVDLARFLAAFENRDASPLLTRPYVDTLWAPYPGSITFDGYWYGCGWFVRPVSATGKNTWHSGILQPGTLAYVVHRSDGVGWAVAFNCDYAPPSMPAAGDIDWQLHVATDSISAWPAGDLFAFWFPSAAMSIPDFVRAWRGFHMTGVIPPGADLNGDGLLGHADAELAVGTGLVDS